MEIIDSTKQSLYDNYEKLCQLMEHQTVGTELLIYGTSGLMLLAAFAKSRSPYVMHSFKKPSHVSSRWINNSRLRNGIVQAVKQNGQETVLLIRPKHRTLMSYLFNTTTDVSPIRLAGITANGNGMSWLQNCLLGREAVFVPLPKSSAAFGPASVHREHLCLLPPEKGKYFLDISETLLKLRFARLLMAKNENENRGKLTNRSAVAYYKHLAKIESNAQLKEACLATVYQRPWLLQSFHYFKTLLLSKEKLLPELVR